MFGGEFPKGTDGSIVGDEADNEAREVDWIVYGNSDCEDAKLVYISVADLAGFEANLETVALIHGVMDTEIRPRHESMTACTIGVNNVHFHGIKNYTGTKRMSIMSLEQYRQYCARFGLNLAICTACKREVNGIGGRRKSIDVAIVQVASGILAWQWT